MVVRSDFTVGWICANDTELTAARLTLETSIKTVDDLGEVTNDNNSYSFGSIGTHNIVIAVLAIGEYGTTNAAVVARDMVKAFPSLRFTLMVGIGGGLPLIKDDTVVSDIRLGDVVVSSPSEGKGGVVQVDLGKRTETGFLRTGHLNQPPQILLTATHSLKSDIELEEHSIKDDVDARLAGKRKLQRFSRPSIETDRLFKSSFRLDDKLNSSEIDTELIARQPRDDEPEIHYGLIASSNTVLKEAQTRDELARDGFFCVEMEAAGLMNQFPVLVIRGICDYADSHKSKEWQGHAAMNAAAYASLLLRKITSANVSATQRLSETEEMKELLVSVNAMGQAVDESIDLQRQQFDRAKQQAVNDQEKKLWQWLSPASPNANHQEAKAKRYGGSGQWLLENSAFQSWMAEGPSFFWLHGLSGCGKTVLSSTVIDHITTHKEDSTILLYWYFTFRDSRQQTLSDMCRWLINQLYLKCTAVRHLLDLAYTTHNHGTSHLSLDDVSGCLASMLRKAQETHTVLIVLDALDESTDRERVLSYIEDQLEIGSSKLKCFLTSRPEHDIRSYIESFTIETSVLAIPEALVDDDIRLFVHETIKNHRGLRRWHEHPSVQNEIEEKLVQKAGGMFRWAACMLDDIASCIDLPSLRKALLSLPKTLNEVYDRMFCRIPPEHQYKARLILQLVTYSASHWSLLLDEIADAVAVSPEYGYAFHAEHRPPDPEELVTICGGLISISTVSRFDDKHVHLAHLSVQEYLLSTDIHGKPGAQVTEVEAHTLITKTCLGYLISTDKMEELDTGNLALRQYASQHWIDHLRQISAPDEDLINLVMMLSSAHFVFGTDPFCSHLNISREHRFDLHYINARRICRCPLMIAACTGHTPLILGLLASASFAVLPTCQRCKALDVAAAFCDLEVVDTICKIGLPVHLLTVCLGEMNGKSGVLKFLLDNMVKPLTDQSLKTACFAGAAAVAEHILDRGIPMTVDVFQAACLHNRSFHTRGWCIQLSDEQLRYNRTRLVEMFLNRGVPSIDTAMQIACVTCRPDMVQATAQAASKIGSKSFPEALGSAIKQRASQCVQILLDLGTEPTDEHVRGAYQSNGTRKISACKERMEILDCPQRVRLLKCCAQSVIDVDLYRMMLDFRQEIRQHYGTGEMLPDFTAYVRRAEYLTSEMFCELCWFDDVDILKLAIERGAKPGSNAMTAAVSGKCLKAVILLYSVNIPLPKDVISLVYSRKKSRRKRKAESFVQMLIKYSGEVNVDDIAYAIRHAKYLAVPRALWYASCISEDTLSARIEEMKSVSSTPGLISRRFELLLQKQAAHLPCLAKDDDPDELLVDGEPWYSAEEDEMVTETESDESDIETEGDELDEPKGLNDLDELSEN